MPSLNEYLHSFSRSASGGVDLLETEIRKIDSEREGIQSALETARQAQTRVETFIPMFGLDYTCPRCWIMHGRQSALRAIPSKNSRIDLFRCNQCDADYEVNA